MVDFVFIIIMNLEYQIIFIYFLHLLNIINMKSINNEKKTILGLVGVINKVKRRWIGLGCRLCMWMREMIFFVRRLG